MPRKHRRVHHPRTNCRCPEGAKRVETCKKGADPSTCKGRTFGCVAMVLKPGARKPLPRFVKMICDQEAGPVQQWKPPGKGKKKTRRKKGDQLVLRFNRQTPVPPPPDPVQLPIDFDRPRQLPLFNNQQQTPSGDKIPSWWRT